MTVHGHREVNTGERISEIRHRVHVRPQPLALVTVQVQPLERQNPVLPPQPVVVRDFVKAWTKVMNLDRFDLAPGKI